MKIFKPQPTLGYEQLQKLARRQKWLIRTLATLLVVTYITLGWLVAYRTAEGLWLKAIVISSVEVKHVQAKEVEVLPDIGDCEQYRSVVEKYFGKLTDEALFVASKESGCIADRISQQNTNGSRDYCLFQINREKLASQSLDVCVRRAWEKYQAGRIGTSNWSAWYAVCSQSGNPKHPKVIKNCK